MPRDPVVASVAVAQRALLVGALLSSSPWLAAAQLQGAWEAGAGVSGTSTGATMQRTLGGAARLDRPFASLEANAGVRDTGRTWLGDAGLRALVMTPGWAGFRLSLGSDVRHVAAPARLPFAFRATPLGVLDRPAVATAWTATSSARLSFAHGTSGAWLGLDAAQARADSEPATARFGLGVWTQLRDVVISLRVGSRAARLGGRAERSGFTSVPVVRGDTSRFGDTVRVKFDTTYEQQSWRENAVASQLRQWTELESQLSWARGRLALDGVVGMRPRITSRPASSLNLARDTVGGAKPSYSFAPSVWAQATATYVVGTRVALVGGLGIIPTAVGTPLPHSRFATLGVRLAPPAFRRAALPEGVRPTATTFALRPGAPGEYVVALHAPGARVVELSGDFTGWQPIGLREVATGRWEATVRMAPGAHRCNVRIDGDRWIAPAGTTPVEDDFNGRVGLIVAP